MRQSSKVEGTKIAQAAKDLNVTSVTIRRYIAEFNIETTSDENGIKVLPDQAMEELKEIRRLKEDGLTNPKVLEFLEDFRTKEKPEKEAKPKGRKKAEPATSARTRKEVVEEPEEEAPAKVERKKTARRISKPEPEVVEEQPDETPEQADVDASEEGETDANGELKSKHSLTCQTCSKVFEHMNPRLRDCLECYRAKRKERRRGGDRHKNVIQHPLAQQVANKAAQQSDRAALLDREERLDRPEREERPARGERPDRGDRLERGDRAERPERAERPDRGEREDRDRSARVDRSRPVREDRFDRSDRSAALAASASAAVSPAAFSAAPPRQGVRNYRKAIEETRQITGSLKRRLERPDLPEGERRWLEQIYAYQLILHQGWRHLAEYKAATQQQSKGHGGGSSAPANQD